MSRNQKDKYDNSNSRRNHTIMTPEEAAAGKKTNWTELEITGTELNSKQISSDFSLRSFTLNFLFQALSRT